MNELKTSPQSTLQDRQKMIGILDRFEKQAILQEEILNSDAAQAPSNHQPRTLPGDSLHSSISNRRSLSVQGRNEILRKTIQQDSRDETDETDEMNDEERADLEQILELEHQDFVNRFAGMDLNQESFESIWTKLTPDEQQEFQGKFMLTHRDMDTAPTGLDGSIEPGLAEMSDEEGDDEEKVERQAAKELLKEMSETMKRGSKISDSTRTTTAAIPSKTDNNPLTADLDALDLKTIRDAEISELIPTWTPWWEVEAEVMGHLKKVIVKTVDNDQAKAESAMASALANEVGPSKTKPSATPPFESQAVMETYVLDEEAMLRSHKQLVQDMDDINTDTQTGGVVLPLVKEPHPSLMYYIAGLLFSYAATIRLFNGDLTEEPELVLAYIFDLCPLFAPPPPPAHSIASGSTSQANVTRLQTIATQPSIDVQDFETTLAVIQRASLNSRLWKGDTSRHEMLALLLRDLTLLLAKPSRCIRGIRDMKRVFEMCMDPPKATQLQSPLLLKTQGRIPVPSPAPKRRRLFTKTLLHRLLKKLEFYESFLFSKNLIESSDNRLDPVRIEVVMVGIQVRQEMAGWTKEVENVTRVSGTISPTRKSSEDRCKNDDANKRLLIEEM
ncbi:hypothetical protein BG004_007834 [Podila humilis]|nr:hypothetical protein BG004_007834 [Podila humilis]